MGWNHATADWSVVEGALFPDGGSTGVWTMIAMAVCVVILFVGNRTEKKHLNSAKK